MLSTFSTNSFLVCHSTWWDRWWGCLEDIGKSRNQFGVGIRWCSFKITYLGKNHLHLQFEDKGKGVSKLFRKHFCICRIKIRKPVFCPLEQSFHLSRQEVQGSIRCSMSPTIFPRLRFFSFATRYCCFSHLSVFCPALDLLPFSTYTFHDLFLRALWPNVEGSGHVTAHVNVLMFSFKGHCT